MIIEMIRTGWKCWEVDIVTCMGLSPQEFWSSANIFANPLTGSFWWNKKCVLHMFVTNRCWPCEALLWRPSSALGSSNRVASQWELDCTTSTLYIVWLVAWNMFYVSIFGNNNPNWRTPSFFRGVGRYTTNQLYSYVVHMSCSTFWHRFHNPPFLIQHQAPALRHECL